MATNTELESKHCHRCGEPLAGAELSGNCPRCLATLLLSPGPAEAVESFPIPIIRRLGDYELLEEVARGGMGIVFRARQVSLDRIVAVKLLRDSALAQPEDVRRFRAEAAAAGRLKHPNIVAIHEVGEDQGQHYLAMDLVEGPNLAQFTRDGPLESRRAAEITARIAEAVQHAHAQGILHRDLKPSNVLMDAAGEVFVTDFGLARPLDTGSSLTITGQVLGTPAYMSPEQASGLSEGVGPTADVYSLGALLFHLLTARPPFVSSSLPELMRQVAKEEPLSPQLLNSSVPDDLATVCLRCLAKRPADRYGSAREFADDLRRYLRGEPVAARPASRTEKLWHWCRREPALAASLGFALFVLIIGVAASTWQWRRADREAHTAKEELWHAQLLEARSYRLNGGFGQRTRDLETIAKAAAYRPSVELRNEVIAALVLPDVGTNIWWRTEYNAAVPSAFTGDLEFFVPFNATGHVAVCHSSSQQRVAEFDGPAASTRFTQFSPDARLLAVQFRDGAVRVWDWRARHLVLVVSSAQEGVGLPAFDFTPNSHELWLAGPEQKLERYALPEGKPLPLPTMNVLVSGIRLDRTGARLLAFKDKELSAWNVTTGERLGQWTLPGEVWRVAWHPHGREFAVGTYGTGMFVGEVGQTNLDLLEAPDPKIAPTAMAFTPDGSQVLVDGWGSLFAAWDFATRKLALWSRQLWFGQLSSGGQQVAMLDENRGYGVRQFLNPVGIRRFRVPGQLNGGVNAADWLPGGEWLVAAHVGGWSLWDAQHGELLVARRSASCNSIQVCKDGRGFLTGGADGPVFWPLSVVEGNPQVGEPRRLLPENSGANERATLSPDGPRFAAVGTNGAFLGSLAGDSLLLTIPAAAADTIQFSPDGRWLRSGSHHDTAVHIRAAADGALVTNLLTGSSGALFVPGRNELLTGGPSGFSFWQVGTWQKLRDLPIRDDGSCSEFAGFWPDGSCALANGKDLMLRLWDVNANREIACLRLAEGSGAWACVFDPSRRFMVTTTSYPFMRLWDLPALRRELRELGLDWPDAQPGRGFVRADGTLRKE
jgi:serine/threonine protein kinase/WD40 repeat protein